MTAPSDPRTLVLHGLRLKGVADAPTVAEAVGLDVAEVEAELEALAADSLVVQREGSLAGFALTPAGRADLGRHLREELDRHGVRDAVVDAYERFVALNRELLDACTAWQLREDEPGGEPVVNDHADADYDAAVIERLVAIDARVQPICADLARSLARFGRYGPRLTHALERLRSGDKDWFTKPMIPSYHTIWFELHEDLLATLGIDREQEAAV